MSLITLENLKTKLLNSGKFNQDSIPNNEVLSLFIEVTEELIKDWLGYDPNLKEYIEKLKSNERYLVTLNYYPISEVKSVNILLPEQPPKPLNYLETNSLWYGNHTIYVPYKNTMVEVNYLAGFDPLPSLFEITIYLIIEYLLSVNSQYPDVSSLSEPTKDISSLSLPGGLSKSYKYGDTKDNSKSNYSGTQFDRLMTPLKRYKRQYKF